MKWPVLELDELVQIRTGTLNPQDYPSEQFELFSIPGFDSGEPEILNGKDIRSSKTIVQPGDVLFSKLNPRIPRVWIVPEAKGFQQISSTEFWPLISKRNILDEKYLRYYVLLLSEQGAFSDSIEAATKSRSRIKPYHLLKRKCPLPTPSEQLRVVDLLDQADALRKRRSEANVKSARILHALFYKKFGDPTKNLMKWEIRLLGDVCQRITDGTHQPPPFAESGIPFLFVQNIVKGYIDFNTEKFISRDTYDELTHSIAPQRGDVLYSTVGSYGVAVVVDTDSLFLFQRHIGHIRPNLDLIDPWFLSVQLNSPFVKAQADQRARGIAQKTLNLGEIRQFQVIVPPLVEQLSFKEKVNKLNLLTNNMKKQTLYIERLFKTLMSSAFTGELTTKWRMAHMKELLAEMEAQTKTLSSKVGL